jgi:putative membrane protein
MDIRPYGFGPPPDGFRGGDEMPFRDALVQHVDGGGPGSLAWAIFAIVLVLLLLAIASLAIDAYYRHRGVRTATPSASVESSRALALLDDRYARGDISRDDYLRARDDLRGSTEAPTQVIPPEPEPA